MSKVWIGILLGAALGMLDGMGAYAYPEVRDKIIGIVIGSTFKGFLTGLIAGLVARKTNSLPIGIAVGFGVGLLLSFLVAAMPHEQGRHFYWQIMLPGSILGAIVGFATQKFGKQQVTASKPSY
jgi:peptidoglycan/LPS O-acetylase OafA/YrhL